VKDKQKKKNSNFEHCTPVRLVIYLFNYLTSFTDCIDISRTESLYLKQMESSLNSIYKKIDVSQDEDYLEVTFAKESCSKFLDFLATSHILPSIVAAVRKDVVNRAPNSQVFDNMETELVICKFLHQIATEKKEDETVHHFD